MELVKLSCPECGASLDYDPSSGVEAITCPACHASVPVEEVTGVREEKPVGPLPPSVLQVGMRGTIDEEECMIIGRVVYENGRLERWNEWLIRTESGKYLWLDEDGNNYRILTQCEPITHIDPVRLDEEDSTYYCGKQYHVWEKSQAKVVYFEGEFTWQMERGDTSWYLDLVATPEVIAVDFTPDEIQYYTGRYIFAEDVYESFGIKEDPPEPEFFDPAMPFRGFTGIRSSLFLPVLAFTAIYFALIFVSYFDDGIPVLEVTPGNATLLKGDVVGSFELEEPAIVCINTNCPALDNAWCWVGVTLFNEDKKYTMSCSLMNEYYHGYSGGEYWSEGSSSDHRLMKLDEPGKYDVYVEGEIGKWPKSPRDDPKKIPVGLRLTINVDPGVTRYYLAAFILHFLLLMWVVWEYIDYTAKRSEELGLYEDDDD